MTNKIKIIAEIGWNHMGNIHLAEKMMATLKAGADFCKFQTWSVDNLKKVLGTRMVEEKFMKKHNLVSQTT